MEVADADGIKKLIMGTKWPLNCLTHSSPVCGPVDIRHRNCNTDYKVALGTVCSISYGILYQIM